MPKISALSQNSDIEFIAAALAKLSFEPGASTDKKIDGLVEVVRALVERELAQLSPGDEAAVMSRLAEHLA